MPPSVRDALFPPAFVRGGFNGSFREDCIMSRVTTPPVARPAMSGGTPTMTPPAPTTAAVPREKIAMRAYEKWLKGGCPHGCDQQHWLEAESELKSELSRHTRR